MQDELLLLSPLVVSGHARVPELKNVLDRDTRRELVPVLL
jgi:hypothetical protein